MKLGEGALAYLEQLAGAAIDAGLREKLNKPGEWVPLQPLLDAVPELKITLGDAPSLSLGAMTTTGTATGKTAVFQLNSHDIKVAILLLDLGALSDFTLGWPCAGRQGAATCGKAPSILNRFLL